MIFIPQDMWAENNNILPDENPNQSKAVHAKYKFFGNKSHSQENRSEIPNQTALFLQANRKPDQYYTICNKRRKMDWLD